MLLQGSFDICTVTVITISLIFIILTITSQLTLSFHETNNPSCFIISCFADHILKQILPPGAEVPSSFETIVEYITSGCYIYLFLFLSLDYSFLVRILEKKS